MTGGRCLVARSFIGAPLRAEPMMEAARLASPIWNPIPRGPGVGVPYSVPRGLLAAAALTAGFSVQCIIITMWISAYLFVAHRIGHAWRRCRAGGAAQL